MPVRLDHQWIRRLANFALEGFPEIRDVVVSMLLVLFGAEPLHETLQVDVAETPVALAAADQRVISLGVRRPAESALRVFLSPAGA